MKNGGKNKNVGFIILTFGTLIEVVLQSNLTNFGVSRTNSVAQTQFQKSTFLVVTFVLLTSLRMLITSFF